MGVLGGLKKGLLFVLSAPAGTGKTTLVKMLTQEFSSISKSISFTTRAPRSEEVQDKDYHFITEAEFKKKVAAGEFLEHAEVFGHHYGTSKVTVEKELAKGKHLILVIDTQGAMKIKKLMKAIFIFLSPPNFDELKKRLEGRHSETEAAIALRLAWARKELLVKDQYDYQIVNENLQTAYEILRAILIAEEHRVRKH